MATLRKVFYDAIGAVREAEKIIHGGRISRESVEARRLLSAGSDLLEDLITKEGAEIGKPALQLALLLAAGAVLQRAELSKEAALFERAKAHVQKAAALGADLGAAQAMLAHIVLALSKSSATPEADKERLLLEAVEVFVKCSADDIDKQAVDDVKTALERLSPAPPKGEKAPPRLTGEFMKEGGGKKSKNWKTRWFVLDDTTVSYHLDQKTWEKGGTPPKGSIDLDAVSAVYTHADVNNCTVPRPKQVKDQACLHLQTPERTYNIAGLHDTAEVQKWIKTVQHAVRTYQARLAGQRWIREHRDAPERDALAKLESLAKRVDNLEDKPVAIKYQGYIVDVVARLKSR